MLIQKEDEPRVLFVGQVHAEEILGLEIVIDMWMIFCSRCKHTYSHVHIKKVSRYMVYTNNKS